ncbi:MAG: septum formation protein Maf [Parachlamydiales bacterium]|nr:septum formation protein Maf [Parachlamydiales bacterium]
MTRFILASQSPRRREVLQYFSLPFEQRAPQFDERSIPFEGDPKAYVLAIAQKKVEEMGPQFPDGVVITADTSVYFKDQIFGKPKDEDDAIRMLTTLSGQWHEVYTAVCVYRFGKIYSGVEMTKVHFNEITPHQIQQYLKSTKYFDKAGSYAIQQSGALLVKEIAGCYYNVMGLPVNLLSKLLEQADFKLWNYLGDR